MPNRQKLFTTLRTKRKHFVGPKELFGIQAPEIRVGSLVDKLCEDGTLVLKEVQTGTECEMCFVIYFIVF